MGGFLRVHVVHERAQVGVAGEDGRRLGGVDLGCGELAGLVDAEEAGEEGLLVGGEWFAAVGGGCWVAVGVGGLGGGGGVGSVGGGGGREEACSECLDWWLAWLSLREERPAAMAEWLWNWTWRRHYAVFLFGAFEVFEVFEVRPGR